eukprot:5294654-Amphidinium_carterae.1
MRVEEPTLDRGIPRLNAQAIQRSQPRQGASVRQQRERRKVRVMHQMQPAGPSVWLDRGLSCKPMLAREPCRIILQNA